MRSKKWHRLTVSLVVAALATFGVVASGDDARSASSSASSMGVVKCANLVYARVKTSVCFSAAFLKDIEEQANIRTQHRFSKVRLDSTDLYEHPFAVMTGEGPFSLTSSERKNLRNYLLSGGFLVASAGCSSKPWNESVRRELALMFPKIQTKKLTAEHPVFHTVYDITTSKYKSGASKLPVLEGIEIDGKIVLIWSPDGLNDTKTLGSKCCCCGGNEVKNAKRINVNLLAYALTH